MGPFGGRYLFALVAGIALLAATPRPTIATSQAPRPATGGRPAAVVLQLSPRCFTYQHPQRARIMVRGLRPYDMVSLEWAVTSPHSSGGLAVGPGVERANAHGIVHISFPAPTKYFSDMNRWVLTVVGPRNHPLASVHFRVVEGHPAYLPPTGPSQSCP